MVQVQIWQDRAFSIASLRLQSTDLSILTAVPTSRPSR